ncbi:MAG: hypothetical protein R3D85_12555 [Paracoccaceae bacterium]
MRSAKAAASLGAASPARAASSSASGTTPRPRWSIGSVMTGGKLGMRLDGQDGIADRSAAFSQKSFQADRLRAGRQFGD